MFPDLAVAFMAFVFIFALACILLERRNCNTSAAKTPKRRPKRRKTVTRRHCEDHHGFTGRRGPEEHSDDESYNPRGKITSIRKCPGTPRDIEPKSKLNISFYLMQHTPLWRSKFRILGIKKALTKEL
ncbi:unnamed protein product [Porites lobata]|uniref:Secreted protein n=1 Tax=Porites lobata TaxID=104759 RepID=A0ABN8RU64_9CNID|nr:unnamed protein product [Porites lobata]